jgi:RecA-family ATPase
MANIDLRSLARALGGEVRGDEVLCPGPGHSAKDRSLAVKPDDDAPDRFVVHSFAGDDPIACKNYVREKAGLPAFDDIAEDTTVKSNGKRKPAFDISKVIAAQVNAAPKGRIVETYPYKNVDGALQYEVLRYEPKGFRQRRPDGNGDWIWKIDNTPRVLYRLADLLKFPDASVFVCEGEKDANRVAELNLCATTVACGDWTDDCVQTLAGRDVLILEDNDEAGRKKALKAAQALHGTAKTIRIVCLPGLADKGDVSDWFDADSRNADKFVDVCFEASLWAPETAAGDGGGDHAGDHDGDRDRDHDRDEAAGADTKSETTGRQPLPFINVANWDDEPVPELEWAVPDRIPLRQVTLFSGEGSAGKSTTQLLLSFAHVLARDWLGFMPEPGPALFVDAEDDEKILHRRSAAILDHYGGATFKEVAKRGLHLVSLIGQDAVLGAASRLSGVIQPTPLFKRLLEAAADIKPKMIGIASSANVYAGSEIDRQQVQQFISLLTAVARAANGALVLISHPSLTGINTDTGLSGNTAWHNAVRARFYMKGVKPEAGEQPDNDLREIVFKKNNYGPISDTIVVRYQNSLFLPVPGMASLDRAAREGNAEAIFLELLSRFTRENRRVCSTPCSIYAPAAFAQEDAAKKASLTSRDLANAMRRLFTAGKIWNENHGKQSNKRFHLACK